MGRLPITGKHHLNVTIATDKHGRLAHHATRMGMDMTDIVRLALDEKLDFLDEKEAATIHHKQLRKGAFVPSPPQHRHNDMPTLKKRKMMQGAKPPISFASPEHTRVSEKLQRSFRRWAEYIEDAEDRIDADRRAKVVLDEIRDRASSENEVTACFDEFKDFLSARKEAREKPSHVVDIDSVPIVAGDVGE